MAFSSSLIAPPSVSIMASSSSSSLFPADPSIGIISRPTPPPCGRRLSTVQPKPAIRALITSVAGAPWLMLPPTFERGDTIYNFYNLTNKNVTNFSIGGGDTEVVGSSHGFLAILDKRTHELCLYNPISRRRILLPSIHSNLALSDIGLGPVDMRVNKVIISDDLSRAVMIFGPANRLAFCCPGRSTEWTPLGALFLQQNSIKHDGDKNARVYLDIVYSKRDKLFTCLTDYDVEEWDLRFSRTGDQLNLVYPLEFEPEKPFRDNRDIEPKNHHRPRPSWWWPRDINTWRSRYSNENIVKKEAYVVFAEHTNQLYLVYRYIMERGEYMKYSSRDETIPYRDWDDSYPHKTIGFSVYKVARVGVRMLQLNYIKQGSTLDNLVMFLGRNHSFALPAHDYPDLKPDSIYFTDTPNYAPLDWQTYGAHDSGIYSFTHTTFHSFDYHFDIHVSSIRGIVPPPLWFTPSPL